MKKRNSKKQPAVFLDRDGTLIEEVNYLSRVDEMRLFEYTAAALRMLKENGYLLIVVTNQSGIGRGIFEESAMHEVHDQIQKELAGAIDAFYFCPHRPDHGCRCRKPLPGMIESACADFDIDLEASWIVGDKKTDAETGRDAGIRNVLVLTGHGRAHSGLLEHTPDLISADLADAVDKIVGLLAVEV